MAKGVHQHVTGEGAAPVTAGAIALPEGKAPEWIKLFPYGTYRGRDGRGPYTLSGPDHAARVIAATAAYQAGADLAGDYEHQTQRSVINGKPAPAAAWVKQLEAREDGLYARVDWTAPAAAAIETKEYRYVSPTWFGDGPDNTGNVVRVAGFGLTNNPNFTLPAIASQQGDLMDPELLKLLGLPATASQADILAAVQKLMNGHTSVCKLLGIPETTTPDQVATAAQAAMTPLATALKVEPNAGLPAMASAVQAVVAQSVAAGQVDLTKYVPMAVHAEVAGQLAELQKRSVKTEADRAVEAAMAEGKVSPAQKAWAAEYASQNLPAFKAYVAAAPVIVTPATASQQGQVPGGAPPANGQQGKLSADDLAIANQMGLSPEEYAKALAEEAK